MSQGALKRQRWGICDQFLGHKQRVSKHCINKDGPLRTESSSIQRMRQPQRHRRFQKSDFRGQDAEWTVGHFGQQGVPSGTSQAGLRMEGFSAEPPGLAQHPWQRQQGEKGMLSTRFLLVKPATAKPPSFPSTRLFDRRTSKLPDRGVGQLQAPHARCTCRAPKDPSTHIPRCSWQLHRNSVRQSSLSMGAWARTCRSLPEKHLPSRPTTDESGSGLHPDNAAASPDFIS